MEHLVNDNDVVRYQNGKENYFPILRFFKEQDLLEVLASLQKVIASMAMMQSKIMYESGGDQPVDSLNTADDIAVIHRLESVIIEAMKS